MGGKISKGDDSDMILYGQVNHISITNVAIMIIQYEKNRPSFSRTFFSDKLNKSFGQEIVLNPY